jgi:hypothetical protein
MSFQRATDMSSSPAAPGASTASLPDFHRLVRMMPHEAVTATALIAEHEPRTTELDARRSQAVPAAGHLRPSLSTSSIRLVRADAPQTDRLLAHQTPDFDSFASGRKSPIVKASNPNRPTIVRRWIGALVGALRDCPAASWSRWPREDDPHGQVAQAAERCNRLGVSHSGAREVYFGQITKIINITKLINSPLIRS